MKTDLEQLRTALSEVERRARSHAWSRERPWKTATHTWVEGQAVVVDLHDLGRGTATLATRAALELAPELASTEFVLVTGRGRHSVGPGVLRDAVEQQLRAEVGPRGLAYRPRGPGRWAIVMREERSHTSLGTLFFWGLLAIVSAVLLTGAWLATR